MSFLAKLKLFLLVMCVATLSTVCAPRLTLVIVVDQLAHSFLPRLKPHFRGGLATLLDYGVVYDNAYYPHAMPATATGHAALSTGCFARDHGYISNKWYTPDSKLIRCDDAPAQEAAVFSKNGKPLSYGKSSKFLMVEGVSDQFMLQEKPGIVHKAFSLSYKSRAAIATASDLGKAIWFNSSSGNFTTSKAYFSELPKWVQNFNKSKKIDAKRTIDWHLRFPKKTGAYNFTNAENYTHTVFGKSMVGTRIPIPDPKNQKKPYELMLLTPYANQLLLDLAIACIDNNLSKERNDKLLIWVSLSSLDKLGHRYGPNSLEMIDMIYQLDRQLKRFMRKVSSRVKGREILYVLTSDHGVAPIPEIAQEKGIKNAHRINEKEMLKAANKFIGRRHGMQNLILHYRTPQFYLDEKLFTSLDLQKQSHVMADLKTFFQSIPGIARVWSIQDLLLDNFAPTDIRSFYKNQIYPGRSGHLAIQIRPFCQTTKYSAGTAHRTPYEDNTHVPLIFYRKGWYQEEKIPQRVSMLQFANTLAQALDVPKPPASTFDVLPGLFP